jgi:hypothetical protein
MSKKGSYNEGTRSSHFLIISIKYMVGTWSMEMKSATWSIEMIGVETTYYKSLPLPLHLLPWISV